MSKIAFGFALSLAALALAACEQAGTSVAQNQQPGGPAYSGVTANGQATCGEFDNCLPGTSAPYAMQGTFGN